MFFSFFNSFNFNRTKDFNDGNFHPLSVILAKLKN